jgi:hypothetical protein
MHQTQGLQKIVGISLGFEIISMLHSTLALVTSISKNIMVLLFEDENVADDSRYYINQTMKSNQMDLGPHFLC